MNSRILALPRLPVRIGALFVAFLALVIAAPALAADAAQPDWLIMGIGLFGGLALFLYGMELMTAGLKAAAGEQMKNVLGKLLIR